MSHETPTGPLSCTVARNNDGRCDDCDDAVVGCDDDGCDDDGCDDDGCDSGCDKDEDEDGCPFVIPCRIPI